VLRRRDPSGGGEQLIAANVDVVGIVCGLDRPVRIGRIQRFTSLAWDAGASPLVILNKADLVEDPGTTIEEILEHDPFAEVVAVSSTTAAGVAPLLERSRRQTLVLVGESGAGKSTLTNALAGVDVADTGQVRHGDHKGRHTTTSRQLHVLGDGGCLIDTPGVREVGLVTDTDTIDEGFADVAELAADCRFSDCGHATEPGCAIRAAVESGALSEDRLAAWDKLRREAAYEERRSDVAARRSLDRTRGKMYRAATKARKERD
jgi:ribosome biogenesis GTPase